MSEPQPRLASRPEAARRLGLSLRSVDRLIASGELKVERRGPRVLVSEAELECYLEALPLKTSR